MAPSNAEDGIYLEQLVGPESKSPPSSLEKSQRSHADSSQPCSLPLRLPQPVRNLHPRPVPNVAPNSSSACGSFAAGCRAQKHSGEEWEEMKPILHQWYIEEELPLQRVIEKARERGFGATMKMYKSHFTSWGFRKYGRTSYPMRQGRDQICNIASPKKLQHLEAMVWATRDYVRAQFDSHGWIGTSFAYEKKQKPQQWIDLRAAEIQLLYSMHLMYQKQPSKAIKTLASFFERLIHTALYRHPTLLNGHWLMSQKICELCTMAGDKGLDLLRSLARYQAGIARICLRDLQPMRIILLGTDEISKVDPLLLEQAFQNGLLASANCLEEKLGPSHPTVLLTWVNLKWYWQSPIAETKQLALRYEQALAESEAVLGPNEPMTICLLHDFTHYLFYGIGAQERAREPVMKLIERAGGLVRAGSPGPHVSRAYAFATVALGQFTLINDQLDEFNGIFQAAMSWLEQGGSFAPMQMEMLKADRDTIIVAWSERQELARSKLNFARPRCMDSEREFYQWSPTLPT